MNPHDYDKTKLEKAERLFNSMDDVTLARVLNRGLALKEKRDEKLKQLGVEPPEMMYKLHPCQELENTRIVLELLHQRGYAFD
jgi:hypothetical protein